MSFGSFTSSWLVWSDPGTPSPVLALAFNEGSGTTFSPTIGPGTGTITPGYGQWIAGPIAGTALGRYGSGAGAIDSNLCAVLSGLSSLNTASWTGITVMAWVSFHALTTSVRWPILLMNGTTFNDGWMGWEMSYNTYKITSWVNGVSIQSANEIVTGSEWVHLCTTWDGTTQRVYANGSLVASVAVAGPLYATTAMAVGSVGYNYGAQGVDDLRIYNQALTGAQITTLMGVAV